MAKSSERLLKPFGAGGKPAGRRRGLLVYLRLDGWGRASSTPLPFSVRENGRKWCLGVSVRVCVRVRVRVCVRVSDGNMDDQELNEPQNRVALLKGNHGNSSQLCSSALCCTNRPSEVTVQDKDSVVQLGVH